jgi:hypothetical protein
MRLVAVVRAPAHPEEAATALARATGLTAAEARMRLAPEPPALVARLEPDAARALVEALRAVGLAALSIDAQPALARDRTAARSVVMDDEGVSFVPRAGEPVALSWPDVLAVLRGSRASVSEVERTERSKRLSIGAAVMTGGLKLTSTTSKTVRSSEESIEQVILVYARDGREAVIAEGAFDFSCLGAGMQPSSTANMAELARRLREKATTAFHDERLLRLGRRPLPQLPGGTVRTQTAVITRTNTDTSGSLDVLAELLRQAVVEGLLP